MCQGLSSNWSSEVSVAEPIVDAALHSVKRGAEFEASAVGSGAKVHVHILSLSRPAGRKAELESAADRPAVVELSVRSAPHADNGGFNLIAGPSPTALSVDENIVKREASAACDAAERLDLRFQRVHSHDAFRVSNACAGRVGFDTEHELAARSLPVVADRAAAETALKRVRLAGHCANAGDANGHFIRPSVAAHYADIEAGPVISWRDHRSLGVGTCWKIGCGSNPFVMIMHHCSGYQPSMIWMEMVAKRFLAEGYGVAMPNSFDPRYVDSSCGLPDLHWGRRRAEDAYSVLDYLIERKLAVPNQVYITGYSNGGLTSLVALTKRMAGHKNKFAAAFPIVPSCISVTIKGGDYYNPVVVFVGGKDQANLPKYCIELGQKKRSTPVQVFILKDADHGYMINKPAIVYKVSADQGGMSWSMTYNEAATNFTMDTILNALRTKQFAKNSMVFK